MVRLRCGALPDLILLPDYGVMMKVLTYNVHGWLTPDGGTANVDRLAEVIAATGADLVGLNEVFHPWHTPAGPALKVLADSLNMAYAFGPTLPAEPTPTGVPYGNALLSRWPILAYATHHLAPTVSYGRRGLLEVRVSLPSGQPFTLYVTHLDHRSEAIRLEQWASANAWLLRDRGRPHLLLGDFNALAGVDYPAPETVEQLKAYQIAQGWPVPAFDLIAQVLKAGYVDAFARAGRGPRQTWPSAAPERRIDYIFLPEVMADRLIRCSRWDGPAALSASDHLPILAEFDG
jgi:endonuclease/exonuclease/phosphatase family metal-dependent hydrolase